jgi:hypothetical protein
VSSLRSSLNPTTIYLNVYSEFLTFDGLQSNTLLILHPYPVGVQEVSPDNALT